MLYDLAKKITIISDRKKAIRLYILEVLQMSYPNYNITLDTQEEDMLDNIFTINLTAGKWNNTPFEKHSFKYKLTIEDIKENYIKEPRLSFKYIDVDYLEVNNYKPVN